MVSSTCSPLRRIVEFFVVVIFLAVPRPAETATITVDETVCALVDAITAANTDTVTGGCAAGVGSDVLELTVDVLLSEVVEFENGPGGLPSVNSDITVAGNGFTIARDDAAPDFRIFHVKGPRASLTLEEVVVTNGRTDDDGGAIFNSVASRVVVRQSTLSGNTADAGGGLYNRGVSTFIASTVSGNAANSTGGGVENADSATLRLENSTVSGNGAALRGGGINNGVASDLTIRHSTLAGNGADDGGGIHNDVFFLRLAISGSLIGDSPSGGNCGGPDFFLDGSKNFADDSTCGPGFALMVADLDFDTTLADNGGPTLTHPLILGSVAIDAAGACGLDTDQRGVQRNDGACDSGAFEGTGDFDLDGLNDSVDNCPFDPNPNQEDADEDGVGDPCDNCPSDVNPDQGDLDGDGVGDACNDADDMDGDEWSDALDNCPLDPNSGQEDLDGDGVGDACNDADDMDGDEWSDALDNCPFDANPGQADLDGDGIGNVCDACPIDPDNDGDDDGLCGDVDNCPLTPNPDQGDTDGDGVGDACDLPIVVDDVSCTLADAITAANTDTAAGGCTSGAGSDVIELTRDVLLTDVAADVNGPSGLPSVSSRVTLAGNGFTVARDDTAPDFRIFHVRGARASLTLEEIVVANGRTPGRGGGIFNSESSRVILRRSTLSGNSADIGGGLYNRGEATLIATTVEGNSASSTGGGIENFDFAMLRIGNSTLSGNSAVERGGGINNGVSSDLTIRHSTLADNAANNGGGIHNDVLFLPIAISASLIGESPSGGNCGGPDFFLSGSNNFADDSTCGPGFAPIVSDVDFDTALADNGGPTLTHALLPGSVAIDAAGDCGLETDQRGNPRDDGACDSGSVELVDQSFRKSR